MKFLLYLSFNDAQSRCYKAFAYIHCQDVNTTAYAVPIKHTTQDLWAVPIDEDYQYLFTEQEISEAQELPEDWFPKIDINNLNK